MSSGNDPSTHMTLSEINVTPLVDVMLVLLTIFMVASSVETIQVAAEREKLLKEKREEEQAAQLMAKLEKLKEDKQDEATDRLRDLRRMQFMQMQEDRLKQVEEALDDRSQNVPIELPKVTSEAVNLAEQRKIVVTLTRELDFFIGDTRVVSCTDKAFSAVPGAAVLTALAGQPGVAVAGAPVPGAAAVVSDAAFRACLKAIQAKMTANAKLKTDQECYLRADERVEYGRVLALMATIRRAGITKFGLVSEEEPEETAAASN
jgi:biopolymer transport protein ExbD